MEADTQTAHQNSAILHLPSEVIVNILEDHLYAFPVHEPHQYGGLWDGLDRNTLYNLRLVCRRFNEIISPLLCPVVTVDLSSASMVRLEGLLSNESIATGVHGIAISLKFRPHAMAASFYRFHAYAESILEKCIRVCDWHTEFQTYMDDDESDDAVQFRNYHAAWSKLEQVRYAWQSLMKQGKAEADPRESEDDEGLEAQATLQRAFGDYVAAHEDQVRIVRDGSFVQSLKTALSRCAPSPYLWFNEVPLGEAEIADDPISVTTQKGALFAALVRPHEWLSIESDLCKDEGDDSDLFFPASIMTALPIACHDAGTKLRGIQVDCFPLLRGYSSLLPDVVGRREPHDADVWAPFAAACQGLEVFCFGQQGMNCTPSRPHGQTARDMSIINGFLGAACSGPHLEILSLSMTSFRVRSEQELAYPASRILDSLTSRRLRVILVLTVDVCERALIRLVHAASASHLTRLYLASITLSQGCYAGCMDVLRGVVVSRHQCRSSKPDIAFHSLQGAEFGVPTTAREGRRRWMFSSEEGSEASWDSAEDRQAELLGRVEEWVTDGETDAPNPLVAGQST